MNDDDTNASGVAPAPRWPAPGGGLRFRPSKRQKAYLDAWLDPSMPKTVHGICQALGIPRSNVYYWLQRPAFVDWFNRSVDEHTEHMWRPVLIKLGHLAAQGSVEHMKLLAQIRGAIRTGDDDVSRHGAVTVVIGVPRPGDAAAIPGDARPTLPPVASSRYEN